MVDYVGARSLDAEITLDFIKKEVLMDYSLNKFGCPLESNTSTVMNSSFRNLSVFERAYQFGLSVVRMSVFTPVLLCSPVITYLAHFNLIQNPKIHSLYQKFLAYTFKNVSGVFEQTKIGKLYEPTLTFYIRDNVWFEYALEGDYQDKIKSVSLKRRFVTHYLYGKYRREVQRGWNVIFEFTEIPQNGSCVLKHT